MAFGYLQVFNEQKKMYCIVLKKNLLQFVVVDPSLEPSLC